MRTSGDLGDDGSGRSGAHAEEGETSLITAAFVLEQILGHGTHANNLQMLVPAVADGRFTAHFLPVDFDLGTRRMPGHRNWTVRAGARARQGLAHLVDETGRDPDVMFVHTQVPAVRLGRWMRRVPTVVSLDATPLQFHELGEFYSHTQGAAPVERLKFELNRRCFERAAHLVTWSAWARQGLIDGYGVAGERVTVIPPGVDVNRWHRPEVRTVSDGPVRVLFVGGDLKRKGGDLLIEAVRVLREAGDLDVELHLVTSADIGDAPGVTIHQGLTANSAGLIEQYHLADIFCLPTHGDCLPMVLAEAAAAGLPMVSTDVGAIHEIVRPGETGDLVPTNDVDALVTSLRRLVEDADLRMSYGAAARRLASADHDARDNARRLVALLASVARTAT